MKRVNFYVAVYFAVAIAVASLVTSCATTTHCDAYGQANYSQNQDTASK